MQIHSKSTNAPIPILFGVYWGVQPDLYFRVLIKCKNHYPAKFHCASAWFSLINRRVVFDDWLIFQKLPSLSSGPIEIHPPDLSCIPVAGKVTTNSSDHHTEFKGVEHLNVVRSHIIDCLGDIIIICFLALNACRMMHPHQLRFRGSHRFNVFGIRAVNPL